MRTRALVFVVIASGALMLSQQASAQVLAPGGVTIYDSTGCVSDVRDAKVTVPFSIGITGLRPNSSTLIFVTDKDANPDVVYGPGIFTADQQGNICLDILDAPVGLWKIDVVEQGSGFTDSKVFAVGESETPPITLPTTTTTLPPATTEPTTTTTLPPATTEPTTTTTLPPATTEPTTTTTLPPATTEPTTTTTLPPATTEPTTTSPTAPPITPPDTEPGSVTRPFDELPWVIQEVEAGSVASIPGTGGSGVIPAGVLAVTLVGLGGLVIVTTRRRAGP